MRKQWSYIALIIGLIAIFVAVQIWNPKPIDWTPTLASEDKIPFGTYVLDDLMTDLFPEVQKSYRTLYEKDSLENNQMIISTNYYPDEQDFEMLLNHVSHGGTALISAHFFSDFFQDTLSFYVDDYLFEGELARNFLAGDTATLSFTNPSLSKEEFRYQRNNVFRSFTEIDTATARILAVNDLGQPVAIRQPFGEGEFILNSTPIAFTNAYLLLDSNERFISDMLSIMPEESIHWAEYYMQGRRESATPLRYILSQPGLKWSYYILLISLFLYMILESKRKQRVIPVIEPPKNTTLEFVGTVSSLYYKKKDHKSIVNKRISFFLDQLKRQYYLPQHLEGRELYQRIASKSGKSIDEVSEIMELVLNTRLKPSISEAELKEVNTKIESFNL